MTEIDTKPQYQSPQSDQKDQLEAPDSPYRKSRNTIDLTFKNLSYTVTIKNPDRKGKSDPKCINTYL